MNSFSTPFSPTMLLAQADIMLLLADVLGPPAEACPRLQGVEPADLDGLVEAAALGDYSQQVRSALGQLLHCAQELTQDAWSDEYHRLFEGATACPLNETAIIRRDKGVIIGDLAGFYRAFGWTPASRDGEKPDHLRTELEFLAMLLTMAGCAPQTQGDPSAEVTRKAIDAFVVDHLGDWILAVQEQLSIWTAIPFYRDAAEAIRCTWVALATVHAWPVISPNITPLTSDPDDTPYECGAPGAEVPVELTIHPQTGNG